MLSCKLELLSPLTSKLRVDQLSSRLPPVPAFLRNWLECLLLTRAMLLSLSNLWSLPPTKTSSLTKEWSLSSSPLSTSLSTRSTWTSLPSKPEDLVLWLLSPLKEVQLRMRLELLMELMLLPKLPLMTLQTDWATSNRKLTSIKETSIPGTNLLLMKVSDVKMKSLLITPELMRERINSEYLTLLLNYSKPGL